jgi:hypothetical protein
MSLDEAIHIIELNMLSAIAILDTLTNQLHNDKDNIHIKQAIRSAENNVNIMSNTLTCINNAKISMEITRIACMKDS